MTIVDEQTAMAHRGGHRGARAGFALSTTTAIVAAIAVIGGGSAFAFFTHSNSSSPTSGTVSNGPVVTTTTVTPTGAVLYPGGPKGDFTITVNPSTHPVRITDIVQDTSRSVVVSNAPGCPGTVVTLTAQHNLTLDVDATAVTRAFAHAVSISVTAPSACQGATFEIPVILTGRSR